MIDAAVILTITTGAATVEKCGADWVLGTLELLAILTFGLAPLATALMAVGVAVMFPALRRPRTSVLVAAVLSFVAIAVIVDAQVHFPEPNNLAACAL